MDSKQPQVFSLKYQNHAPILQFLNSAHSIAPHMQSPEELLPIDFLPPGISHGEILLEQIRATSYSELPSRLNSIFLFESLKDAKRFRLSGWTEPNGLINEYEICELYSQTFAADMSLVNAIGNLRAKWEELKSVKRIFIKSTLKESIEFICHSYWQGKTANDLGFSGENSLREILVNGKTRLLNHISLGERNVFQEK